MLRDDADDDTFPEMVPPPAPPQEEPEPIEQIKEEIPQVQEQPEEDDIIIHPEPKPKLKKEDMFISTPSSKKVNQDKEQEDTTPDIQPVKKPRKKRVMTEEHKAKLAEARKKGLETRMRNAQLRKKEKEEKQQEKEEAKQIAKAVRKKRIAQLKKELDQDVPPVKPKPEKKEPEPEQHPVFDPKPQIINKGYTQEDLNNAINSALEKQEVARKARKAVKKKKQEEEAQQKKIYNTVSRAIDPNSAWDICFN